VLCVIIDRALPQDAVFRDADAHKKSADRFFEFIERFENELVVYPIPL